MQRSITKKLGTGFMILLMCTNVFQAAAAQGSMGNPQLMRDIEVLNKVSGNYNSKSTKDKSRVSDTLASFENLMGRKLSISEKAFLSLQFTTMKSLPSFEVKGNSIQVYDLGEGPKDLVVSVEVLNAEKNTFKFGERVFQIDPNKPIHENIQQVLRELEKGDKVSFWQKFNPFGIPHAQAAMPDWLKFVLIGAVALVAGILIGKAIQKKKDKKNGMIAENVREVRRGGGGGEEAASEEVEETNSHEADASSATVENSEPTPTEGEEPAIV